jgi:hypothetical protein
MRRKIIGATVGTNISPSAMERKINPVKSVNGVDPDENGNVEVKGNSGVYVGPGEIPEGYNIQIDPTGEAPVLVQSVNGVKPDPSGNVEIELPDSGGSEYTLPIATPDTLGGVKPVAKTDDMTQPVGADELGGLWTAPGSGGSNGGFNDNPLELINEITLDQATFLVEITKDSNGEPFELEDFYFQVDALTTDDGSRVVNGHLTINDVFMQSIESGWGKDVTNMNYTHTLHYFNAGQVVFFTRREGSSQWTYTKTSVKMINRPITKVQINLSVSSIHYQVGASFKLYGRRVKK